MREEQFVELPPELCFFKIKGFTKEIGRTLSLLPSIMHRLENLLLASQLKEVFSSSFPKGSEVSTAHVGNSFDVIVVFILYSLRTVFTCPKF